MKDVMTGSEKVDYVVQLIKDKRAVQPLGFPVEINSLEVDDAIFLPEFSSILNKLEVDDEVISFSCKTDKVRLHGVPDLDLYSFKITVHEEFDKRYGSSTATATSTLVGQLTYDDELGEASFNGVERKLFEANTTEDIVLKKLIKADGARLNGTDLQIAIDDSRILGDTDASDKTLNNTKRRINRKLMSAFAIEEVIKSEHKMYWIDSRYVSEQSPYRK